MFECLHVQQESIKTIIWLDKINVVEWQESMTIGNVVEWHNEIIL